MEENKQEIIEKVQKEVNELSNINFTEDVIRNNKIEFEYEGIRYRIRKPTFQEKEKTNQERIKKYIELLKDPNNLLERNLIKLYLDRDIDIKEMQTKLENLAKQRNDFAFRLGEAIKENKPQDELEIFKKEIEKIIVEQQTISIEKTLLMDAAIESQVNLFVFTFLGHLITDREIKNGDTLIWTKAWDNYAAFMNEPENLVNRVVWNVTLVARSDVLSI